MTLYAMPYMNTINRIA